MRAPVKLVRLPKLILLLIAVFMAVGANITGLVCAGNQVLRMMPGDHYAFVGMNSRGRL